MNKVMIKKRYLFMSIMLVLVISILFFTTNNNYNTSKNINTENLPINYLSGSYSINTEDYRELAGDADNIFVAKIDKLIDTEYRDMFKREDESKNMEDWGSPYTNYEVTVLENIKGNLIKDTPIPITKSGGVIYDNSAIEVYENDQLPKVGNIYVMYGYTQSDGSILVSGPNSNHELDLKNNKTILHKNDVYEKIFTGYKNAIESNRVHQKSIYENK